jgi:hypothetical protein
MFEKIQAFKVHEELKKADRMRKLIDTEFHPANSQLLKLETRDV